MTGRSTLDLWRDHDWLPSVRREIDRKAVGIAEADEARLLTDFISELVAEAACRGRKARAVTVPPGLDRALDVLNAPELGWIEVRDGGAYLTSVFWKAARARRWTVPGMLLAGRPFLKGVLQGGPTLRQLLGINLDPFKAWITHSVLYRALRHQRIEERITEGKAALILQRAILRDLANPNRSHAVRALSWRDVSGVLHWSETSLRADIRKARQALEKRKRVRR